ncbi:MAG: Uma2 family endonuclease [Polyangiaceae bacterium]|nr:Uma2 family endonuclease [Polyangiaceae bacterium]
MAETAKKRATYEDLLAVPDGMVAQIIDAELVVMPRPASAHARSASRLGMDLGSPFDRGKGGPGGWIILDEPELHLRADVLVPDLAGWRRERMPELPHTPAFTLAPDWVCEVLSPSTQSIDRVRKMNIYAREGVAHAWLLDPNAQTLEVYQLSGEHWIRSGSWEGAATVRAEPFDAIELELAGLWER